MNNTSVWLYVKQHNITGLKYFGKHTGKNPYRYKGSGQYWNKHINKHGNNVTTIWCELFNDIDSLKEFAIFFSEEFNIVKSDKWANLILENGIDGVMNGNIPWNKGKTGIIKDSIETKRKKSIALTGIIRGPQTAEHKKNQSKSMIGKLVGYKHTIETIEKRQKSKTGEKHKSHKLHGPQLLVVCPHCFKEGGNSVMQRHHFNRCKFKETQHE